MKREQADGTPSWHSPCPRCGRVLDGHIAVDDPDDEARAPDNGSLTICAYCATISVWENEELRWPTTVEADQFAASGQVQHAVTLVKQSWRGR